MKMRNSFQSIEDYIGDSDWRIGENANIGKSIQGLMLNESQIRAAAYMRDFYGPEIAKAHEDCKIHIHDYGNITVYCMGWDTAEISRNGHPSINGGIDAKPAKSLQGLLGQILNLTYSFQSECSGAQSWSHLDSVCAPYCQLISYKEIKQALQSFIFCINWASVRQGSQSCFSNVQLDVISKTGKYQYEMDKFNEAFCEVMKEGDGGGKPFTFPIPTFNVTKKMLSHPTFKNNVCDLTADKGSPYFANFINSELNEDDVTSMCCRLRLDNSELKRRGGLFSTYPMTGSIGVITLNLPYILNQKEPFELLDKYLNLARKCLNLKRSKIEEWCDKDMYPYIKRYLAPFKQSFGEYFYNHFNTIGIVGGKEAMNNAGLRIETNSDELYVLMERILERIKEFQIEDGYLWNFEATPAEGVSYRFAKHDLSCRDRDMPDYRGMQFSGEYKAPFYTNSTQLPVDCDFDLESKLRHQSFLNKHYTGGSVFHVYTETELDKEMVYNLINWAFHKFDIPYMSVTPVFGYCEKHGKFLGKQCMKGED